MKRTCCLWSTLSHEQKKSTESEASKVLLNCALRSGFFLSWNNVYVECRHASEASSMHSMYLNEYKMPSWVLWLYLARIPRPCTRAGGRRPARSSQWTSRHTPGSSGRSRTSPGSRSWGGLCRTGELQHAYMTLLVRSWGSNKLQLQFMAPWRHRLTL